jgi:hypothetical protein
LQGTYNQEKQTPKNNRIKEKAVKPFNNGPAGHKAHSSTKP